MRDYSEFIQFIIEKTGLDKPLLVERDIIGWLETMYSERIICLRAVPV